MTIAALRLAQPPRRVVAMKVPTSDEFVGFLRSLRRDQWQRIADWGLANYKAGGAGEATYAFIANGYRAGSPDIAAEAVGSLVPRDCLGAFWVVTGAHMEIQAQAVYRERNSRLVMLPAVYEVDKP